MDYANQAIFVVGFLLVVSVLASRISSRVGVPLLLLFLVLGMLMGEEGPGGIAFDDIYAANLVASFALAVILFDGGLRTPFTSFRTGLKPALLLATIGVIVTAGITGLAAAFLLDRSWLDGLLIGAIVGSTDAAAVFYLLHAHGLKLNERIQSTLEIESGSNDPVAIFLTLGFIELVLGKSQNPGLYMLLEFCRQMGIGAVVGLFGGWILARLSNRIILPASLYPLLAFGGGISIYGLAAVLGGSGFLAAYLGGLLLGNRVRRSGNSIRRFHDGMAWLSQIILFLMLGLLVTPTELIPVIPEALLAALVLIFLARPAAVFLCLAPFRFSWRERVFISWVGLRGAVPIVLGLYPLLAGVAGAQAGFSVAFVIVLASLILQGWTVAPAARWLGLQIPQGAAGVRLAEYDTPGLEDNELVVYEIPEGSSAVGHFLDHLQMPPQSQLLGVVRNNRALQRIKDVTLNTGDQVYLLAHPDERPALEELFGQLQSSAAAAETEFFGEFVLVSDIRFDELREVYGLDVSAAPQGVETVMSLLETAFDRALVVGDRVQVGKLQLIARQVENGRVTRVGIKLPPGEGPQV